MKFFLKNLAYRLGVLSACHRMRNRNSLTVAMFHRVLPVSDVRYAGADPEWTMTPDCFAHCLGFFKRHYHLVTPEQVFAALQGEGTLPPRSLLVTFDDGWADTEEYARPILDAHQVCALVFVAGSAIDQNMPFWEERVFSFLATHPDGLPHLQTLLAAQGIAWPSPLASLPTTIAEQHIRIVIRELGRLDRSRVLKATAALPAAQDTPAAMLTQQQLAALAGASHVIGGHGMVHSPLTKVPELAHELENAQRKLRECLQRASIDSMSFPHGAYSAEVVHACRVAGYKYLFSSEACLNIVAPSAANEARPVGRIHLSEREIVDQQRRFQPALLATSLFLRPIVSLHQSSRPQHA